MPPISRKRLLRTRGRSGGDSEYFAQVPVAVLTSSACRTLPHVARSVLFALAAQYYGVNNGSLPLTRRIARQYGIANSHTLGAALRELQARGLIRQSRPGTRVPPRSAFFALEWRAINEPVTRDPHCERPTLKAANSWETWTATTNRPHWTVERRFSRWHKATSLNGVGPHQDSEIGGPRPPEKPDLPVAHSHASHISGMGAG